MSSPAGASGRLRRACLCCPAPGQGNWSIYPLSLCPGCSLASISSLPGVWAESAPVARKRLLAASQVLAVGSWWWGLHWQEQCGRGTGSVSTGMEGGTPPLLHAIRGPISKPREFACAFRDFWGTAVETPGWGWTEREGVSLPFWPRLPAHHSKSHGAMWLLSIPCILPFQVA